MPYSSPLFDKKITKFFKDKKFEKYLDIGCGAGKYADIIHSVNPEAVIEGIEPDLSYRLKFRLGSKYNTLYRTTIQQFIPHHLETTYDCVIFGDILEHLKKSDGLDAINFFMYRSQCIVVNFPYNFVQYGWQGHVQENHLSVWGKSDFANFEYEYFQKGIMRLVIIKGFLAYPQKERT